MKPVSPLVHYSAADPLFDHQSGARRKDTNQAVEACRADYLRIKQAGNEVTAGELAAALGAYREALENLSEASYKLSTRPAERNSPPFLISGSKTRNSSPLMLTITKRSS
jgi:hypothetical protein